MIWNRTRDLMIKKPLNQSAGQLKHKHGTDRHTRMVKMTTILLLLLFIWIHFFILITEQTQYLHPGKIFQFY